MATVRHFHRIATLTHRLSATSTATSGASCSYSSLTTKIPLLFSFTNNNNTDPTRQNDAVTLELLSWGRGASGQLGGGIEEIRLYPSPVANLVVPKASFDLSQTPGRHPRTSEVAGGFSGGETEKKVLEVGISCGLFHSSLIVDGSLWVWGKGDGGRLGLGHEDSLFVPTLNPHLDNVRCVALGGLHSVALTSKGEVFTWSESLQPCI